MTTANKSFGIGVIGTGGMGARHARNIDQYIVGAHVAGLFDVDETSARAVASHCADAPIFTSAQELIGDRRIDAVIIASPDQTHATYTLQCLQAGKPVLCEKPLAVSAEAAWPVVQAEIERERAYVTVGFMRRFDPAHVGLFEAVRTDRIGRPYLYKGVHRNQSIPADFPRESVISQSAIHDIDATRWLMDREIDHVYVYSTQVDPSLDDQARDLVLLTMQLTGDAFATIEVFLSAKYGYEVTAEVVGSRGTVVTRSPAQTVIRVEEARSVEIPTIWLDRFAKAYVREVQHWVNALQSDEHVGASAWDGYVATLVADACNKSLVSEAPESITRPHKPDLYK